VIDAIGWLMVGLGVYLALGCVFAVVFVTRGVGAIDPAARGAGWGFRVLIVPGSALFWPLLFKKWAGAKVGRAVPLAELPTDDGTAVDRATSVSDATTVVESGARDGGDRP
jgi:hypothetical protein